MRVKEVVPKPRHPLLPRFHGREFEWRTFPCLPTLLIKQPTSQEGPVKGLKSQSIKFSRLILCHLSLEEGSKLTQWKPNHSKEIHGTIIPYTAPSVPKDSRALYGVGKVKFCHLFCRTQRLLNVQEFSSLDQDMKRGLVEPDNLGLSAPFLKFICLERLPPAWRNPRNGCLCTEISRTEIPNTAWIKPSFSIHFFHIWSKTCFSERLCF